MSDRVYTNGPEDGGKQRGPTIKEDSRKKKYRYYRQSPYQDIRQSQRNFLTISGSAAKRTPHQHFHYHRMFGIRREVATLVCLDRIEFVHLVFGKANLIKPVKPETETEDYENCQGTDDGPIEGEDSTRPSRAQAGQKT